MKAQEHGEYLRKIIGQNHCLKILDWTFPVEIISWMHVKINIVLCFTFA